MNRKDYLKPTMKVVKLKQQTHLLQASVNATLYNDGSFTEEDI